MSEEQVDRFTFALNTKVNDMGEPEGNGGQGESHNRPSQHIPLPSKFHRFAIIRTVTLSTLLPEISWLNSEGLAEAITSFLVVKTLSKPFPKPLRTPR